MTFPEEGEDGMRHTKLRCLHLWVQTVKRNEKELHLAELNYRMIGPVGGKSKYKQARGGESTLFRIIESFSGLKKVKGTLTSTG